MKNERLHSIDFIKAFAVFSVILLHSAVYKGTKIDILGINLYRIINVSVRFAVPFFFMASAYLFYSKYSIDKSYINKFLKRIARLAFIWYIIYAIYDLFLAKHTLGYIFPPLPIAGIIPRLYASLWGGMITISSHHLWYLWATIVIIFILKLYFKITQKLIPLLIIALSLNFLGMFGMWQSLNFLIPQNSPVKFVFTREALHFGLLYFTLGMVLAKYKGNKLFKLDSYIYLISFLLFTLLSIFESKYFSTISNTNILADYYFFTIPSVVCLFLFAINSPELGKGSLINLIGKESMYYYLSHVALLHLSYTYIYSGRVDLNSHSFNLLFAPILILILSFIILPLKRVVRARKRAKEDLIKLLD